jgi:ActR/RegA family two-component response regulator
MSGSDCPILIVEDDALLGFDLASVLQQRGYEVIGPCPLRSWTSGELSSGSMW